MDKKHLTHPLCFKGIRKRKELHYELKEFHFNSYYQDRIYIKKTFFKAIIKI